MVNWIFKPLLLKSLGISSTIKPYYNRNFKFKSFEVELRFPIAGAAAS